MDKVDLIIKNKNKILNFGIIFLFLFIALQIYRFGNKQETLLIEQKENELKKNKAIENIASLEKQVEGYKKAFVRQDLGTVMDRMSSIAKDHSVKIISIKPIKEESYAEYTIFLFIITAKAGDYHSLAEFISKIENYKSIYLVEAVDIVSSVSSQGADSGKRDLSVTLKIGTISY